EVCRINDSDRPVGVIIDTAVVHVGDGVGLGGAEGVVDLYAGRNWQQRGVEHRAAYALTTGAIGNRRRDHGRERDGAATGGISGREANKALYVVDGPGDGIDVGTASIVGRR